MELLYEVEGIGTLLADGENLGEAEYEISVYQDRALKDASGFLRAHSRILHKVFNSRKAELTMANGQPVKFFIRKWTAGSDLAPIEVDGTPERH